jgi:hypothetical protein
MCSLALIRLKVEMVCRTGLHCQAVVSKPHQRFSGGAAALLDGLILPSAGLRFLTPSHVALPANLN